MEGDPQNRLDDLDWLDDLVQCARSAGDDVAFCLMLAERFGGRLPLPGSGLTSVRWGALAAVARVDLTTARILEAHTDALAILAEAGEPVPAGSWGVFAAEAPDRSVTARLTNSGWRLSGVKPWCSLGGVLDHALVTARLDDGTRQLFAVDLRQPSVTASAAGHWVARGLRRVPSVPVRFDGTPATAVGDPDWYLRRPGFAWGGIGVAACWLAGAMALAESLRDKALERKTDAILGMLLGTVDVYLHAARSVLDAAAVAIDKGEADGRAGSLLTLRVRSMIALTAEKVIELVGHGLGPAPLAFDETYARRTADLQLYVRQHHAERDLSALGAALAEP